VGTGGGGEGGRGEGGVLFHLLGFPFYSREVKGHPF
jgi:hypothetical protein